MTQDHALAAAHPSPARWRRPVLVVNAASRRGPEVASVLRARLAAGGLRLHEVHAVTEPARLRGVVGGLLDRRADLILVVGGDGTVGSVSDLLAHAPGAVLGLVPGGTANDLARTLQIPTDPLGAADTVLTGRVADVDLGLAGDEHFVNVASIGLSVGVTRSLTAVTKRRLGPAAYPVAALRAYRTHRSFAARLEFPDGDQPVAELEDLLQVAVANGRFYGGGNVASPDAGIDDHLLDVYAIPRGTLAQRAMVLRHFTSGVFTRHPQVLHVRTRRVVVRTDPALPVNLDGEVTGSTPRSFGVHRNALHVLVPQDSTAARYDPAAG